jgi:hypothetical protein
MAKGRQFSFQKRLRIYWRDQFTCRYCERPMHPLSDDLTLDHVDPAGGDEDDNLTTSCRSCNSSKGRTNGPSFLNRKALINMMEEGAPNLTALAAQELIDAVAAKHGVTGKQLLMPHRTAVLVIARDELANEFRDQGLSYPVIARLMRRKDHSTVIHMIRRHQERCDSHVPGV